MLDVVISFVIWCCSTWQNLKIFLVYGKHPYSVRGDGFVGSTTSAPTTSESNNSPWFIYHDNWGMDSEKRKVIVYACSLNMVEIDRLCLFPPSVLETVRGTLTIRPVFNYLNFPKQLGVPTAICQGDLTGYQFNSPDDKYFENWIWFDTIQFYTSTRIWDRVSIVPLIAPRIAVESGSEVEISFYTKDQ